MSDLCTACLCSGRNLYFIGETGFYHLYSQILNEIHIYDMSDICVRVCWECRALLRKVQLFKQQVKKSYTELLQYVQQNSVTEPLPEPPHLQAQQVFNYSFPHIKSEDIEVSDTVIVKTEDSHDTHYEPENFAHNLEEPRVMEEIVEKPPKLKDKNKPKKKKKPNHKKRNMKPKSKIQRKRSITPEIDHNHDDDIPIDDDHMDDMNIDDFNDKHVTEELEKTVENNDNVPFEETSRLNGSLLKPIKEVLPDKPQCAECGKHFSSKKTYRYHLNVLHKGQNKYPCPRCGKVYQWKSNLGRHLRTHKARDSGELYCELCDKKFSSVATYRQHLRISKRHVPESEFSFQCDECSKKFVNKTRLRDHIDWEHLKKIKFRCQLCNKPFKCHTSLYVHMQNVHTNKEKKDNLCHVCGKSYQNAAKLKYHIVAMHTSETPYQCGQCTAAFGWYSSLYRHVREVHYKMKLQPKKSKKPKKLEVLPSLMPQQLILGQMHQPGPP